MIEIVRRRLPAFALLVAALCALTVAAEARQDRPAYYILYSDGGALYALAPDEGAPLHLGSDIPVPQSLLYDNPDAFLVGDRPVPYLPTSDGLTPLAALRSPDGRTMLYSEADCDGGRCGAPFNLLLADLATGSRNHVSLEQAGLAGTAPIPIAWDASGDTVVFDTFNTVDHTPFAGLWRYRPETAALEPIDLGPGGYNGRLWPSPDNRYLLTTGFPENSTTDAPPRAQPTARIKLLDLTTGQARTIAANPQDGEYFVRGWITADHLPELRQLATTNNQRPAISDQSPAPSPQTPPATSGFQYPMVNHHYGWAWLQWTGSVYHPGVDYNGPGSGNADCGAPIYAVANGTVRYVNTASWGGLVIEHQWQGTTIYSQYGHIYTSLVSTGQEVIRGQQVATIGNVGTVYCHLHWEMREADHPNPAYGPDWNTAILTSPSLVNAYYEDPEWWVENHGRYTACDPGSDEVALFVDTFYTGPCVTRTIGEYADAAAIGLPNDTISSIIVGGVLQAELCEHNDFAGVCETFTESDPDLRDNAIGNDTVSSARVAVAGPLVFAGVSIDDDAAGISNGNGDGQLNPGETIELGISLHNQGDVAVTGVEATLSSDDDYVSPLLDNSVSTYADILGNGTGQQADSWEFTIDPAAPDSHVIVFCLDPISAENGGPWWFCFDLTVQESPAAGCDLYEPNDAANEATSTEYGKSLASASICPAGDVDYYAFDGQAGDRVVLDVDGQSLGSPLDAAVQLLGTDGAAILAESDDEIPGDVLDPKLGYQLTAAGRYTVRVSSEVTGSGGPGYDYTLHLILDGVEPTTEIVSPADNGWLGSTWTTVTVSAVDADSGIHHVEFWWQEAGSGWTMLGTDGDGRDGWTIGFDTSTLPEHQGSALRAVATDWAGNQGEDSSLNVGTDRTPPFSQASAEPFIYTPTASVSWTAGDSLSGVAAVTLWVRYEGGPWGQAGLPAQSGDSGTFKYTFNSGAGVYDFATSAFDSAGNSEGPPAAADASTAYDPSNNVNLPLFRK